MEDGEAMEKEPGALKTLGNRATPPAQTFKKTINFYF